MSCYRCYRCYRSIHWSDMFSSNLCTDLFQSQLRSFLRPCWGHIEVIFHEMNQPAIWGSPIFPDLSIKFLMSRLQRPVQTTAGSDVQSGHLQVAEVRWHRHWDKTPKEHKKKPGFSLISGCWFIRYTLGFDPQWRTQTMARGLGPNRSRWARQTLGIRWPYEIRNNTTTWMVDPMVKRMEHAKNSWKMLKKWWKTLFIDLTSDDDFDDVGEQDLLYKKKTRWAREPKSKTAHSTPFLKMLWCGQLCSGRNRCKIFTETSCALMVSWATIHHSMLCQLRLHSSSRYCC